MAQALDKIFEYGLTKMTIGACALSIYKNMSTRFNRNFPEIPLELDEEIRKSYKGGFTYLNPIYKEKEVMRGIVLDVNSLRYILVL